MTIFGQRLANLAIVAFANAVGFASLFWLWSAFPPFLLYKLVDDELPGLYIVNEKWPLKVDRPDSCENINFHGWQVKLFEKASFLLALLKILLIKSFGGFFIKQIWGLGLAGLKLFGSLKVMNFLFFLLLVSNPD